MKVIKFRTSILLPHLNEEHEKKTERHAPQDHVAEEVHEGAATALGVERDVLVVVVLVVQVVGGDVVVDTGTGGDGVTAAEGNVVVGVL